MLYCFHELSVLEVRESQKSKNKDINIHHVFGEKTQIPTPTY